MIVKVVRYRKDKDWVMFDNIRKIGISEKIRKQQMTLGEDDYNTIIMDMPRTECTCHDDHTGCSSCAFYKVLTCRMEDNSEYSIALDTMCYLLNDNGKTIEKIVVNYDD